MRRAVIAMMLCATPLLAASAHASTGLPERQALKAALRLEAGAAGAGTVTPLPLPGTTPRSTAASAGALARIARRPGPQRVLVGLRSHADRAAVLRRLTALGADAEAFREFGVLAATVPSGAAFVRALAGDPRVAYVERDRPLRTAVEPFDALDPSTGLKYTWFYDTVGAAAAIGAAGGGSQRTVAVLDTGLDVNHPEFLGRVARTFDTRGGGTAVTDTVGHGTFVSGLVAAIDGNGVGGKGVAGNTRVLAIRASLDGSFTTRDLLRGIRYAVRNGGDVLNLSLAGSPGPGARSVTRALATAFFNDVLPVAASGNTGRDGNALQFPAAVVGGRSGSPGIGLSVAATRPDGSHADFSTHNRYVSLAAPGAGPGSPEFGVVSTLPASLGTEWDDPRSPSIILGDPSGARFAYGEGTSFSAPIASGIAALIWQVEGRLASEQVAEVLTRSAQQTVGTGWNRFTGAGVVNGAQAAVLAGTYDVIGPRARGRARRVGLGVRIRMRRTADRTEPGRELAGGVRYGLLASRNGGRTFDVLVSRKRRPIRRTVALRGTRANVFLATACDANGNCGVKRLGRFRP